MRAVRSVAALAVLTTAAALVGISPAAATGAAAATSPPAAPSVARTRGPHVMPMLANPAAPRSAAVAAAASVPPHLAYYGGRVVSHTEVVQVLWGAGSAGGSNGQYLSQVLNTASPSVATFYQGVLNSSYVDWLSEYPTPTQSIGRGSFASQVVITPTTPGSTGTTISDATIQAELKAQITAGNLPAPHQDASGNNNTYYAIFFPHGKKITLGTSSSCVGGGFVAYHGTIANAAGHEIYYGVHPDVQVGSGCEGQGNTGSVFGNVTAVASHELVEMMTDPEVGIAPGIGPPLAWYDGTNGEIGDICNGSPGSTTGLDGLSYSVQTEWSNAQGACIVSAHDFSLAAAPVTVLGGTSGTSSVTSTVVTGTAETVVLSVSGLPAGATAVFSPSSVIAGGGSTLTVNVGAAVAAGSYPLTVKGTAPSVTRTTSLNLTVTRAPVVTSAASTTFTAGTAGTFTVTTTGSPTASLTESGALPSGIAFTDKGNGTATIAGTTTTGGSFPITITAHSAAADATQAFTLVVNQAAVITSASSTTFGLGVNGTFAVTATGFPAPTLSETGPLPAGVKLTDNGNGSATLSGTPTAGTEGVYPLTITASNGIGTPASQSFSLTVTRQAAITSAASTTFVVGSAGSFSVTTAGVPKASISRIGTVPTGVTFVDNGNGTATLSGTPTAGQAGSFPLTITASNGIGSAAVQSFVLTVHQVAAITSVASTTFVVGSPGSFSVMSTGDPAPSLSESGVLPPGISFLDNGNGSASLFGTPGAGALPSYSVTITAQNGVGNDAKQSFVLHVDRPATITSLASATFVVGASASFTVTSSGSPTPTLTQSGALPSGVTFVVNGDGTGTLSGTPAGGTAGSYPLALTAHNGVGPDAQQPFVLTVSQVAAITSTATATFVVGSTGSFSVTSTGDPAPTLTEVGSLPPGVSFVDNGDGTASLSGTPGAGTATTYALAVTAHNGIGTDAHQSFVLRVDGAASITSGAAATFTAGTSGTFTVTSAGAPMPSLGLSPSSVLPSGVTFVDNGDGTATLSGAPTPGVSGDYPLTISAHNGVGPDAQQPFVLRIDPAVVVTTPPSMVAPTGTLPATIGDPVSYTVHASGLPVPTLSTSSVLPAGLALVDHGDGTATLSGVPSSGTAGVYTVVVDAANGVGSSVAETITVVVARRATVLRYDGTTSGSYGGVVALSATLVDAVTGAPVGARTVHLALGTQGVDAVTGGPTGTAAGALTLSQASGTVALSAAFDGDASYAGSSIAVPGGFVISRRTAVVTTGPGYVREITAVRGRAPAFTVRVGVRRPADAPASDLASVPSVRVRLVPIGGGATRSCVSMPGSRTSALTRTSAGGWTVACRFPAGLPLGVYEVVVSLGANRFWAGGTADVLLVTTTTSGGARGAGRLTGVGLPVRTSVAFAFSAQRAGRGGRSIVGHVVSVLSVTDPVSGVVTQHVLTSHTVTALTLRTRRAPYTAVLSGTGRWDSSAAARFSLAVRDTTGAVSDGDRYGQTITAPAATSSGVVGLLRIRAVVVRSGDVAVR